MWKCIHASVLCRTPSDISFFLCVPALFTHNSLPWVSTARDLKISAESLWRKLGKSPEMWQNWATFSKAVKMIKGWCWTARPNTLSTKTSKSTRSEAFLPSESRSKFHLYLHRSQNQQGGKQSNGSDNRSHPPCGPSAVKVHLLLLSCQT